LYKLKKKRKKKNNYLENQVILAILGFPEFHPFPACHQFQVFLPELQLHEFRFHHPRLRSPESPGLMSPVDFFF
jgi:hypothetical protein